MLLEGQQELFLSSRGGSYAGARPPSIDSSLRSGWLATRVPAILKSLKGASSRAANKMLNTTGPVWQEESFDHVLRLQESLKEKLEYIRQNPVRGGLVPRPEDYPWLWIESSRGSDAPVG
jgi:hypothetical protein